MPDRPPGLYMLGGFNGRGMVYVSFHQPPDFDLMVTRRAPGSALAMADLVLSGLQGKEAAERLCTAGLPRSYIVTNKRLQSKENILISTEKPVPLREEESIVKAKL